MRLEYTPYDNINEYLEIIKKHNIKRVYQYRKNGGYYVLNVACSYDIETSSFYVEDQKQTTMYIWQFCFDGVVLIGRTWKEYQQFLRQLEMVFNIDNDNRLIVYVHNLSYEFQFMRKWFEWENVFATDERKPLKALTVDGIEYRDSYILSGYSLAKTGEQLHKYIVKKLVGDLDYDKIRTPKTQLTDKEIAYCVNDVLVVVAYIQEQIEEYGKITKIPLTNTGRVRNYCRNKCYYGNATLKKEKNAIKTEYRKLMRALTLEADEYALLKRCFMGGFTHANALHVQNIEYNVASYDFTSSYPFVMLSEQFPMGKGFKIKIKNLDEYKRLTKKYCLIFDMKLINVHPKIFADNPISISKCWDISKDHVTNNGRVVTADYLITSGTNIDLDIYMKFYEIEHLYITNCVAYVKSYLPKNFMLSILQLYKDKTELKGVEGKDVEYLHSKGMLNSCYGMAVTDIVKDESVYNNEWSTEKVDIKESIEAYNNNRNRFLFYPWGVFVTAYARRNLFSAILECNNDYIYADTDSVKILNHENHKTYFDNYNKMVMLKIKKACLVNNLDEKMFIPKTIKGVEKPIGVWDFEGVYSMFKTLGAKRYLYVDNGKLHATIAGTGKQKAVDYLMGKYKTLENVFKHFDNGLVIPEEHTGKLTHTYIDDEMRGTVVDYMGNEYNYVEKSGIHLSKTAFSLSMTDMFINYVLGVKYEYKL